MHFFVVPNRAIVLSHLLCVAFLSLATLLTVPTIN